MYRRALFFSQFVLMLYALCASSAHANWIGNIQLEYDSPAYLPHGALIQVSFDYEVTEPEGFMVQAYPWCAADDFPDFSWSGSPIFTGTGSATLWFRLNSGDLDIDHVKLRSWNAVTSAPLLEIDLPVQYFFGSHAVYGVGMSCSSPSWLPLGVPFQIQFEAHTELAGGAMVFALPYTQGLPSPGVIVSTGGVIPPGDSSGVQSFYFESPSHVDEILVGMTSADHSLVLLEFSVAVDLTWSDAGMANLSLDPAPPAYLPYGMQVTAEFDYHADTTGDLGVWVRGAYDGTTLNPQIYNGAQPVQDPIGHLSRWFTIPAGAPGEVDMLRLQVNEYGSVGLFDEFLPAEYHFGDHAIFNIQMWPGSTAILDHDAQVHVSFDYATNWPGGVLIFAYPYAGGSGAPYTFSSGSPTYATGTGTGGYWFNIPQPDLLVDEVELSMWSADYTVELLSIMVPTAYYWGEQFYIVDAPEIPSRTLALEQNVPNPFNPNTAISFALTHEAYALLSVYDLRGRHVVNLWDGPALGGQTTVYWNGRDAEGRAMASGVYVYQLESAGVKESRRMVLVR